MNLKERFRSKVPSNTDDMSVGQEVPWSEKDHVQFTKQTQYEINSLVLVHLDLPYELLSLIISYIPNSREVVIDRSDRGLVTWYRYGMIHRNIGPAITNPGEGIQEWYKEGSYHRTDGPAYMNTKRGIEEWWWHGKKHRDNGPAIIDRFRKAEIWYQNDIEHRIGGPSYISPNKEEWRQRGELHREFGPAVVDKMTGRRSYYRHGHQIAAPRV